jgi:Tfp pilus assembly protein PilF
MAMFNPSRRLFVIAVLGCATTCSARPAVAQYMPRFKAAYKALVGKDDNKKVVFEKQEIPAPKVTEQNYAQVQLAIGDTLAKEGNFERAKAAYEAALRNDKSLAAAYHHLARLHEKFGRGDESKELFQQAVELEPNNAEILCDYGYWFYLRKDWKESQRQFQRALQLNPELKRAHNNLGLLYARTGRPDEALKQFALAGLNEADARANLGFVYLSEKRMSEAKTELRQAAAANSAKARDVLASLDRFEKTGRPSIAENTTTRLLAVEAPSGGQVTRLPAPVAESSPNLTVLRDETPATPRAVTPAEESMPYVTVTPVHVATANHPVAPTPEPTPYVTVARVGATRRGKTNVQTVEQAPYLSNSTASGSPQSQVAVPAVEAPSYVAVASKQDELPSTGRPASIEDSSPQFSPVLSDYPHWDTPVAPASAVGFTQTAQQLRIRSNVAPFVRTANTAPAALQSPPATRAPAPAPPKSKSTVRFVPNTSR